MTERKTAVSLVTLESHNHIIGDIERGVKIYERGGTEYMEPAPGEYLAQVPHKNDTRAVTLAFTKDGLDIEHHHCHCSFRLSGNPVCRHIVAAVLAIQGGIPETKLKLGKTYSFEFCVSEQQTAKAVGSGELEVLATPVMIAMMEHAASLLLEDELEESQTSVGTEIVVKHTAASPVGIMASAKATIISVRGRTITFDVCASDESGEIGTGTHTRVIVDGDKLVARAKKRFHAE